MTQAPPEVSSEVLSGISKRINKELEVLPLHSHGAVVSMLNTLAKHRELNMQLQQMKEKDAQQKAAYEEAVEAQRRMQQERAIKQSGLVLA